MKFSGTTRDQPIRSEAGIAREPAADVGRVYVGFVNAYFVGPRRGPWILVDTGLPHMASLIRRRAIERHGVDNPPQAIVLTHGHFDHCGNALELAQEWGVPVYAHPLELPYLDGRSDYPPQDPTVGGALGFMSRAFPHSGTDLGRHLHTLPEDGSVPGMPEWRWLHTPGHTHGHVSLVRDRDKFVIAGDAVATVDQDSPLSMFNLRTAFSVPPAPMTTDWVAARESVALLAEFGPYSLGAGHGRPVRGPFVAQALRNFLRAFAPPRGGRYTVRPAIADETGVIKLPPEIPDPLPKQLLVAGAAAVAAYLLIRALRDDHDDMV